MGEVKRVLRPSGSAFVNLGDKYAGAPSGPRSGMGDGYIRDYELAEFQTRRHVARPVPDKSLLGLPAVFTLGCTGMLAAISKGYIPIDVLERTFRPHMTQWDIDAAFIALRALPGLIGPDPPLDLIWRSEIIWQKVNGLPESVRDRVRRSHEVILHFTKEPRYYSAVDEVRTPHDPASQAHIRKYTGREYGKTNHHRGDLGASNFVGNPLGKLPGSVWAIPSEPLRLPDWLGVQHYAAFPSELPRRIILGWSPSGICVACGEGRWPVVDTERPAEQTGRIRKLAASQVDRGTMDGGTNSTTMGVPASEISRTILGYACGCTPFTDHPGTGSPPREATVKMPGTIPRASDQNGGSKQAGDYQRVGPWREYHLDRWTPPPTRPAVVLDCFGGVGTSAMVARALGRIGISLDLSHAYSRAADWRIHHSGQHGKAISRTNLERQQVLGL